MYSFDKVELEEKVKIMYQKVALDPFGDFHFEMGRSLAEKLGYEADELDKIPKSSVDSFAGVGYHFGLADIKKGEKVLDLGSGSGMDLFLAAMYVGDAGKVVGLDMTIEQLEKAEKLSEEAGFTNVAMEKGYIEKLPFDDNSFDVVISNGVINLSLEKETVFKEIFRVLKENGRMAISDIISEQQLPENIVCDSTLWASCIGGATQVDDYNQLIEKSGLKITSKKDNTEYGFISKGAQGASIDYGVKSASFLANK